MRGWAGQGMPIKVMHLCGLCRPTGTVGTESAEPVLWNWYSWSRYCTKHLSHLVDSVSPHVGRSGYTCAFQMRLESGRLDGPQTEENRRTPFPVARFLAMELPQLVSDCLTEMRGLAK